MLQVFREARRTSPSVIYMPHIHQWWEATGETTRATFLTLLQDLPPTAPILVLATSDSSLRELPIEVSDIAKECKWYSLEVFVEIIAALINLVGSVS